MGERLDFGEVAGLKVDVISETGVPGGCSPVVLCENACFNIASADHQPEY